MAIAAYWTSSRVMSRTWEIIAHNWYLGFTCFGGLAVHFQTFHDKYVTKLNWIDEQVYQELFAICQAFPGAASTKMLYCVILLHDGFLAAVLTFFLWSLPGAVGMFCLSIGVSHIGDSLPRAVYALLSGLNAAVVGIIGLAAVQLAQNAITDKMTRTLVFLGATAGLMYNALWYFPLLMFLAGCASLVFDYRLLHSSIFWVRDLVRRQGVTASEDQAVELANAQEEAEPNVATRVTTPDGPSVARSTSRVDQVSDLPVTANETMSERASPRVVPRERKLDISWQQGTVVLSVFVITFIIFMVLRATLPRPSLLYKMFTNMYLAGTIIFGGGPVVIPLLRQYVVDEGWVTPRDFLIGLAIIQAFPGPNFNFAVYLGSLTAIGGGYTSIWGAIVGYFGIYLPGLAVVHGGMGIWNALRGKRWMKSMLRGINAAAVGLVYTAVYRIWQIGFIDEGFQAGKSLGDDPWWVVVATTAFVGGMWYKLNTPMAIILGAVMGLARYGVVSSLGY